MQKALFSLVLVLLLFSGVFAQDGSLDMTFNPDDKGFGDGKALNGIVHSIAVNPDGKIIAGGGFFVHNSVLCKSIARFLPDGNLDPDFLAGSGFDDEVKS
ncbi:MAG TPA: hypothetical protein DCQ58_09765, partial [Saprospirales bacterium]|nr:hypothetical protein [Saprospirales bacterium]